MPRSYGFGIGFGGRGNGNNEALRIEESGLAAMALEREYVWIARDFLRCSGCRRCEIVCSLRHEGKIWPEASRVRVFMLVPGVEIPHLCAQCHDYPCLKSCPVEALSVHDETKAVAVDREKCISCGKCVTACPGQIPYLHPGDRKAVICDLCEGSPECTKVCEEAGFHAIWSVKEPVNMSRKILARTPEEITEDVAINLYGEKAEELL